MEKKNSSANMSGYSFFEWFKYYKADIMISSMIEAVRGENGLEVFEMRNGDQYLAQFTTNGVESMNAELKRWVDSKFPIDQFINKLEMIVDAQENQYRDALSDTGDFSFSNKYKYLIIGREWFMWDAAKCKLHRKLVFRKDILFASESVNFERNTNQHVSALDNLCSKDLPEQIPEDVADEIITDAKALTFNKHIRKSFNGLDYEARVSHSNRSLVLKVKKGSIVTCSTKECLNYRLYSVCSHSLAIAQYISKVKNLVEYTCKNAQPINLSCLAGFGRPSGSGTKKDFCKKTQ